jgi:hypothetical protein
MRQLRKKLEADPESPQYILTEPGIGYRFIAGRIIYPPPYNALAKGRFYFFFMQLPEIFVTVLYRGG